VAATFPGSRGKARAERKWLCANKELRAPRGVRAARALPERAKLSAHCDSGSDAGG
jgi:hypothetical protein